jgi:tetratricopeptide (TPR) repeat protein
MNSKYEMIQLKPDVSTLSKGTGVYAVPSHRLGGMAGFGEAMSSVLSALFLAVVATSAQDSSNPATLADAIELRRSGYYERAVEVLQTLQEKHDNCPDAAIELARTYLDTGQHVNALNTLETACASQDESAGWHLAKAELAQTTGRFEIAIAEFQAAIKRERKNCRARNRLGLLYELLGRREEAIETYKWFDDLLTGTLPEDAESLTEAAIGFYRYSVMTEHPNLKLRTEHTLHEMLQPAYERLDRTYWPARLAAAELLRSKGVRDESKDDYEAALRINHNDPDIHVGLGQLAYESWDFEEIDRRVERALETNPNHVPALCLKAKGKIRERRFEDAHTAARRALDINPNSLHAIAYAAAAKDSLYDRSAVEAYKKQFDKIAPNSSVYHAILGETLSDRRQYADSEHELERAIELDPTDTESRNELGLMYMQWGLEDKARETLEAAFRLDPYNEKTKNTLDLLDMIDNFAVTETDHFKIKYDAAHDRVVAPYMADYMESIYEELVLDYELDDPTKTKIEIFPTSRQFAVRITGKPFIHTVGACTGWVIALAAPRADAELLGPYNFANTLRHEFTHTVTLAATENRIPHWFTEGLAVLQEDGPRTFISSHLLIEAIRRDDVYTLQTIDWGFIRPKRQADRSRAYAQSEWMCEFLIERFGYGVINRMLAGYKAGKSQPEVMREIVGIEPDQFDKEFAEWSKKQAAGWGFDLTPYENLTKLRALTMLPTKTADQLGRLAVVELANGDDDRALTAAREAVTLDATNVDARTVQAKLLARQLVDEQKQDKEILEELTEALDTLAHHDPDGRTEPKVRAHLLLHDNDYDAAKTHLEKLQRLCPQDPFSYQKLAGIYLKENRDDLALPQLLEVARTDDRDADVPFQIAQIYAKQNRLAEARYWYLRAIHTNPYNPAFHEQLAATLMRQNDPAAAIREYEALTILEPENAQRHADLAFAHLKQGNKESARLAAQKAVSLDESSPAASILKEM